MFFLFNYYPNYVSELSNDHLWFYWVYLFNIESMLENIEQFRTIISEYLTCKSFDVKLYSTKVVHFWSYGFHTDELDQYLLPEGLSENTLYEYNFKLNFKFLFQDFISLKHFSEMTIRAVIKKLCVSWIWKNSEKSTKNFQKSTFIFCKSLWVFQIILPWKKRWKVLNKNPFLCWNCFLRAWMRNSSKYLVKSCEAVLIHVN